MSGHFTLVVIPYRVLTSDSILPAMSNLKKNVKLIEQHHKFEIQPESGVFSGTTQ